MVVDDDKPAAVRSFAMDAPVRIAAIEVTILVSHADRFLDLEGVQASISDAYDRMVGPEKTCDRHKR
jgi:hypothetical protein